MGSNFSCWGGANELSIKNMSEGGDVHLCTPQERDEIPADLNSDLILNAKDAILIQSAMRGYLTRKDFKQPMHNMREARSWYKLVQKYRPADKPLTEMQNKLVTALEQHLVPLDVQRPEDGIEVRAQPALKLENGSVYEGEWDKSGNQHGKGTLITEDGSKVVGCFKKGMLEGLGRMIVATGLVYEGEFKEGKLNGNGKVHGKHGGKFDGALRDGKLHGYGEEAWPDGMKYEGNDEAGQRQGTGKLTLGDGSSYEGEFSQDKMHGSGRYAWKNGNKYSGEWKNNKMHGEGVFEWQDGRRYEGSFVDDLKSGKGKMNWPDGRVYDGEWLLGKQHGQGTYTFFKGDKEITRKGVWDDGCRKSWIDKE